VKTGLISINYLSLVLAYS